MSDGMQTWWCVACGQRGPGVLPATHPFLCIPPTASEHQRLQAEAEATSVALERVRKREAETMEAVRRLLTEDGRNHAGDCLCPWCGLKWAAGKALDDAKANPLPLSSDAGRALLAERDELLAEKERALEAVGEAMNGGLFAAARAQRAEDECARLRAESADLRARLEAAERGQRSAIDHAVEEALLEERERHASEVRRAVEEERREIVALLAQMISEPERCNGPSGELEDAIEAIHSRSRGGAETKPAAESDDGKCLFILPSGRCAGCRNCN